MRIRNEAPYSKQRGLSQVLQGRIFTSRRRARLCRAGQTTHKRTATYNSRRRYQETASCLMVNRRRERKESSHLYSAFLPSGEPQSPYMYSHLGKTQVWSLCAPVRVLAVF
jgi:hypothetical protein